MVDISEYKVGLVLSVEPCGNQKGNKPLKKCVVNVGDEANPVTIVTSTPKISEGSRVACALVGSTVVDEEGGEILLKKTVVGGIMSEGMLCDSRMLGWSGGAVGVAAQIPDTFEIGSAPPATKPRPKQQDEGPPPADDSDNCLFEKKLSKEEKKKLAEEKRKARKAAKEAKKATES